MKKYQACKENNKHGFYETRVQTYDSTIAINTRKITGDLLRTD